MKKFLVALGLILAASSSAFAGNSADLSVAGKIAPGACDFRLNNGGTFDFGKIPSRDINDRWNYYDVATDFVLNCSAPTKIAYRFINNRPVDRSSAGLTYFQCDLDVTNPDSCTYGLRPVGGKTIGTTSIMLFAWGSTWKVRSSDNGISWQEDSGQTSQSTEFWYSFADFASILPEPTALTQEVGSLGIGLMLVNRSLMPSLASEIPIDGSITFELLYL